MHSFSKTLKRIMERRIGDLLLGTLILKVKGINLDCLVYGICNDSRKVKKGDLFFAIKGEKADGHNFVEEAFCKGALACIVEEDRAWDIPYIVVENTRLAFSKACSRIYNDPSKDLDVFGVTGTNGKTTTTYLLAQIFEKGGVSCGVIGSTGCVYNGKRLLLENTTPDSLTLAKLLYEMRSEGVKKVFMEFSSHGIAQMRAAFIEPKGVILTNLSHDHLDYHKDIEEYFMTKYKFVLDVNKAGGICVINVDDPYGERAKKLLPNPCVTYGFRNSADFCIRSYKSSFCGMNFSIIVGDKEFELYSPLFGTHNLYNLASAFALSFHFGIPYEVIKEAFVGAKAPPGRCEVISESPKVIIDYAHTPHALRSVLEAVRSVCKGRLITVFGCGGDRDKEKRPKMGAIAEDFSDVVIVTSDNPRSEDPKMIMDEIKRGMCGRKKILFIEDRKEAIHRAISEARMCDAVLIAGKGDEGYQILRDRIIPFSDRDVAKEILKRKF